MVQKRRPQTKDRHVIRAGIVVGALLLSLVLSGCMTDNEMDSGDGGGEGSISREGSQGNSEGLAIAPAHRFADGDRVDAVVQESGSFALTEYCFPINCLLGTDDHVRIIDLSHEIPVGVPTTVNLVLTNDQEFLAGPGLSVVAEGGTVYHYESHFEASEHEVQAVLMRDDDEAEVLAAIAAGTPGPPVETMWELEGTIEADSVRVLPGVPVVVPSDGSTQGFVATATEGEAEFALWDGEDRFVDTLRTEDGTHEYILPDGAHGEDPVIVVLEGSSPLRLNATGEDPSTGELIPLPVEWNAMGDAMEPAVGETTTWTFEVEKTPVALALTTEEAPYFLTQMDVWIESPQGTVLEGSISCGVCAFDAPAHTWRSAPGDAGHVPGEYKAHVEFGVGAGVVLQAYTLNYSR